MPLSIQKFFVFTLLALCAGQALADTTPPAPYTSFLTQDNTAGKGGNEPGLQEDIDVYSGGMRISIPLLNIPGNGQIDFSFQWSFNSIEPDAGGIHPPRLRTVLGAFVCPMISAVTLQMPDASTYRFYVDAIGSNSAHTVNNWALTCDTSNNAVMKSPDGITWTMGASAQVEHDYWMATSPAGFHSFASHPTDGLVANVGGKFNYLMPTFQTDRYGNYVQYLYTGTTLQVAAASDYRVASFSSLNGFPTALTATGNHSWTFSTSGNNLNLTRPDGQVWVVTLGTGWNTVMTGGTLSGGESIVTSITNPHGGTTQYDYSAYLITNPAIVCATHPDCAQLLEPWLRESPHPVLAHKSTNDGQGHTAQWTYTAFVDLGTSEPPAINAPTAFNSSHMIRHVNVQGADRQYSVVYQFYSPYEFQVKDCMANAWKIGLLVEKDTSVTGAAATQTEAYNWVGQPLGFGTPVGGMGAGACSGLTQRPLLQDATITRDGIAYSTHTLYDTYGRPTAIIETGDLKTRATKRSWLSDTTNWIMNKVTQENIGDGTTTLSSKSYSYNPQGTLNTALVDGVTTSLTYDGTGNVASKKDARGLVTTYADYYRGIPRSETRPFASGTEPGWCPAPRSNVTVTRTVDDFGNVLTYTDARGKTYSYRYDPMDRLTYEQRPVGNPVNISWSASSHSIQRDGYSKVDSLDGFGRSVFTNENGVTVSRSYDGLGRLTFQSYPGSSIGDTYTDYDELNRLVRMHHADQSQQTLGYKGSAEALVDENGKTSSRFYQAYGDPDSKTLIGVYYADLPAAATTINRNALGNVTSVIQGGVTRNWGYDSHNFLVSRTDPETGTTVMGRDAAGNLVRRQVGAQPAAAYTVDGQNRTSSVSFADGLAESVCNTRDAEGNVITQATSTVTRNYQYDDNENLHLEQLTAAGNALSLQHDYDADDRLTLDTYPNGVQVGYAPDNFGRPTTVGSYANGIKYDARGNITSWTAGNTEFTQNKYEDRGWLKETSVSPAGSTPPIPPVLPAAPVPPPGKPQIPVPAPDPRPATPVAPGPQPTPPAPAPVAPTAPAFGDPAAGTAGATVCNNAYRMPVAADYTSGGHTGQLDADVAARNAKVAQCTSDWDTASGAWANGDAWCRSLTPEPKVSDLGSSQHAGQFDALHNTWQNQMNACVPAWNARAGPWAGYYAAKAGYDGAIGVHQNAEIFYSQQMRTWQTAQDSYVAAQTAMNNWQAATTAYQPRLDAYNAALSVWTAQNAQYQAALNAYPAQMATYNAQKAAYDAAVAALQPVMDQAINRDFLGNPVNVDDSVLPNQKRTYGYDALSRLVQADGPWGSGASIKYDGNGNLLSQTLGGYAVTYGYDTRQRLTSTAGTKAYTLTYDGWGNVTSRGGGTSWTYDAAGNLRFSNKGTASQIAYTYDGGGTRVLSVGNGENRLEFYDAHNQLRYEKDLSTLSVKTYFYLAGQKIADNDGANNTWYHNDAVGSPVAATDANHTVLWRNFYHPFGERMLGDGGLVNKQWFGGKTYEDATGLEYFGARWYDPVIGRFMAMDPVDWNEDKATHSFNAYAYANNNPYRNTDPDGRDEIGEAFGEQSPGFANISDVEGRKAARTLTHVVNQLQDSISGWLSNVFSKKDDGEKKAGDSKKSPDATKRPSRVRKGTEQANWDNAEDGQEEGTKVCSTCDKEVKSKPGEKDKDWDNDHIPGWNTRDLKGLDRKGVLDDYNTGTRLRCVHCNRSDNGR